MREVTLGGLKKLAARSSQKRHFAPFFNKYDGREVALSLGVLRAFTGEMECSRVKKMKLGPKKVPESVA